MFGKSKTTKNFVQIVKSGIKPDQNQLMKEVKAASMKACMKQNSSELMSAIRDRGKQLKGIKEKDKNRNNQTNKLKMISRQRKKDERRRR